MLGAVGFIMLPAPQGENVGLVLTMNPAEKAGFIMQPKEKAGLIVTMYPTIDYPSVERVGFIMKPSPNRAGFIMFPINRG